MGLEPFQHFIDTRDQSVPKLSVKSYFFNLRAFADFLNIYDRAFRIVNDFERGILTHLFELDVTHQ